MFINMVLIIKAYSCHVSKELSNNMFDITTLRVRLFAWLFLRLKQPQQSTCLVNIKTKFIYDGY